MNSLDRFAPLPPELADPATLLACVREAHRDPFDEFSSGDPARARRVLVRIGARFTTWTPFMAQDGLTLLHIAARFDLREAAATLLSWGALADALAWPHGEVGPLWRRLGADLPLDLVGEQGLGARGLGPLHLAVLADHGGMVDYLLAHGANPRRDVGLDHGVQGIEPASMLFLAQTVAATANRPSGVAAALQRAESSAELPVENRWLDSSVPGPIMDALRSVATR